MLENWDSHFRDVNVAAPLKATCWVNLDNAQVSNFRDVNVAAPLKASSWVMPPAGNLIFPRR